MNYFLKKNKNRVSLNKILTLVRPVHDSTVLYTKGVYFPPYVNIFRPFGDQRINEVHPLLLLFYSIVNNFKWEVSKLLINK